MLLGEVFFLAEKYRVDAVKVAVIESVKMREIQDENDVLNAVKASEANIHLEKFAEAVDVLGVKFILGTSIIKLSELFSMSQTEEALMLSRLMSKVHKLKDEIELTQQKYVLDAIVRELKYYPY